MGAPWRRHRLTIVQIPLALAMLPLFFVWASWGAARPIDGAPPEVVARLRPGCPAYFVSHGDYSCVEWGLPADGPVKVGLLSAALLADVGLLFGTGWWAQRSRDRAR
jgi:hypothetical protein